MAKFSFTPLTDFLSYRSRPELFTLLIYDMITVTGYTLMMPLISVHFVTNVGFSAAVVGFALAVRQVIQQGLTFIGGMLSDRYGLKPVLCTGLIIRAIGFFILGFADEISTFYLGLLLAGLGGALFDAPFQAATIYMTRPEERRQFYLLVNYIGSTAATIGPLLAIILLFFGFRAVGIVSGLFFLMNVYVALRYFPNRRPNTTSDSPPFRAIFSNRPFLIFVALMCGYWFVVMQINITFPLFAEQLTGRQASASVLYTFSSLLTLILQYFVVRWLQKYFMTHQLLIAGTLIMTLGTVFVGSAQHFSVFLFWIGIYTLGYLISRPMIDILIAHISHPKALGLYVGFANFSMGIGGGIGNFVGGWLYDLGNQHAIPALPWISFGVIGTLSAWALWRYYKTNPQAITQ